LRALHKQQKQTDRYIGKPERNGKQSYQLNET